MITLSDDLALDAVLGRPEITCQFGMNSSDSSMQDAYGGLSAGMGHRIGRTQLRPLLDYFGFGAQDGTRRDRRMDQRLEGATGPLAEFIRQSQSFLPGMYGQSQQIGSEVAARGRGAYDTFSGQLDSALGDLTRYGGDARHATDLASRFADRAANPLADEDLYQVAQRRVLSQLRPGLAARGLEGASGAGAQAESDALRSLATDFAGQRRADQYNAVNTLGQAAQGGAGLAAMRPQLAGQGMEAVGQLAQMLQAQYGIPMQAFGSILNLLTAGQQPGLALTQATAPQIGQSSSGWRLL